MRIETKTVRHYGTDRQYIVKPDGLAELWQQITGRKTVTQVDLDQLRQLAVYFNPSKYQHGLPVKRLA